MSNGNSGSSKAAWAAILSLRPGFTSRSGPIEAGHSQEVGGGDAPSAALPRTEHAVAYRASFPLFRRRYYIAFFAGYEQRDDRRLAIEAQRKSWWHTTFSLSAVAMFTCTLLMSTLAVAYLLKSVLGIDLFEDHFFMHWLFFK